MVDNKWKDIAVLSTAWLMESHFKPKISRKNGLILKAGRNVVLLYSKKKQVVLEGVQAQFQNQRKCNLKFQTLSEAHELNVYQAPIFVILVTIFEKTMQVL